MKLGNFFHLKMDHSSHNNYQSCYSGQVARNFDKYWNDKYDIYEAKEPYEEPSGNDSYGNATYNDKDEWGNYVTEDNE